MNPVLLFPLFSDKYIKILLKEPTVKFENKTKTKRYQKLISHKGTKNMRKRLSSAILSFFLPVALNDATTPEKERHKVKKLYSMMIDVVNGYPVNIKKQRYFIRLYGLKHTFYEKIRLETLLYCSRSTSKSLLHETAKICYVPYMVTKQGCVAALSTKFATDTGCTTLSHTI
ncbi:hypothetical protein BDF21DRAFT_450218 [Thamnidium elegans]|nr:hypothetical protein BDF21DRAFT_450218 [Thamnidium elegans]